MDASIDERQGFIARSGAGERLGLLRFAPNLNARQHANRSRARRGFQVFPSRPLCFASHIRLLFE
jgi:hypothetical protein